MTRTTLPPPCPGPFNLAKYVLGYADKTPDKTALQIIGGLNDSWTFGALQQAVRGTASGLLGQGLTRGDRVLMRLGNTVDFPIAYLGAIAAGLVPIPTSSALTQSEVAGAITQTNPALILHDRAIPCPDHPNIIELAQLRTMRSLPPADWHMDDPNRPGYIVFTSGTSGTPRAVVHAHRAIWARRMMFEGWYGLTRDDRMCHAGAFNWTYTLGTGLMDPWTVGATALIPAPGTLPAALPALLATHKATIFAAAPGVYRQMLRGNDFPRLPHLRHGLSAGEKLAEATRSQWHHATETPMLEAYGLSECSTFLSASPRHPDAIKPQPGRRVTLRDERGEVATDTPGTIAVHRDDPGLMLGYLGAADETDARFDGAWFMTGDQAVMDANGAVIYLGRDDDMMNAGGFRVSPIEVEQALTDMPGLSGIAAVEVTVKRDTTVIAAFYTSASPLDDAALHRYASDKLARYKQPRLYIHMATLPTGANGKIQRRNLRAQFKAPHDPIT